MKFVGGSFTIFDQKKTEKFKMNVQIVQIQKDLRHFDCELRRTTYQLHAGEFHSDFIRLHWLILVGVGVDLNLDILFETCEKRTEYPKILE